jgi:predicted metalloprotease with PDZ domain
MSQISRVSSSRVALVATMVVLWALLAPAIAGVQRVAAQELEPISYVIRIPTPATHEIVVQATLPVTGAASGQASGQASLDLMMPTWSPGYYRVEDYAANVRDVTAETLDDQPLVVEKTNANHWRVGTRGARAVRLSYRVFCNQRTVTTNYVDDEFRQTAEEVAGVDLRPWFKSAVSSTDELDYTELLEWYGLRFVRTSPESGPWTLERHPDQTAEQRQRVAKWLER